MNLIRAQDLLSKLSTRPVFENLFSPYAGCYSQVKTWRQATKAAKFRKWQACQVAVINQYRLFVLKDAQEWGPTYQSLVDEVNKMMDQVSRRAWDLLARSAGDDAPAFHDDFNIHLRWACVEAEAYLHITNPFFLRLFLPVYEAGHIPCGIGGKDAAVDYDQACDLQATDLIVA